MPAMVSGVEVPPGPARPVKDWVGLHRVFRSCSVDRLLLTSRQEPFRPKILDDGWECFEVSTCPKMSLVYMAIWPFWWETGSIMITQWILGSQVSVKPTLMNMVRTPEWFQTQAKRKLLWKEHSHTNMLRTVGFSNVKRRCGVEHHEKQGAPNLIHHFKRQGHIVRWLGFDEPTALASEFLHLSKGLNLGSSVLQSNLSCRKAHHFQRKDWRLSSFLNIF